MPSIEPRTIFCAICLIRFLQVVDLIFLDEEIVQSRKFTHPFDKQTPQLSCRFGISTDILQFLRLILSRLSMNESEVALCVGHDWPCKFLQYSETWCPVLEEVNWIGTKRQPLSIRKKKRLLKIQMRRNNTPV